MTTCKELKLRSDERGAIIGQTGTGKTYLAKHIIPRTGRLAIIDPKREFPINEVSSDIKVFTSATAVLFWKPKRFVYRPEPDEMANLNAYDKIYKYVYDNGNTFLYTDDVVGIMDRNRFPNYLRVCYMMGRSKKVACLSSFQRPSWLPMFLMSEAAKIYVFRLSLKADVDRIANFLHGYNPDLLEDKHVFFYQDIYKRDSAIKLKMPPPKGKGKNASN